MGQESMTDILFQDLLMVHTSMLILSLLLIKIAKLSLGKFVGLYFVMVVLNILVHELINPGDYLISTIVIGLIGFIITLILSGFVGGSMNSSNYSSIMVFVGLTPWYLGIAASVTFSVVAIIILAVYAFTKQSLAFKKVGHSRYISMDLAKQKMTEQEFEIFLKKSNIIFALPMLLSVFISIFLLGA